MPSLTIDLLVAYVWLAISAAAILAGLFAEFKNSGRWAWAVVIGGISLLGWSAYNIHPTLILSRQGSEIPDLQRQVAFRGREIARLQQAEKTAWEVIDSERFQHAATKGRLEATEKEVQRQRQQYEQRLAEATTALATEKSLHRKTYDELRAEKSLHDQTKGRLEAAEKATLRQQQELKARLDEARKELAKETASHAETRRLLEDARKGHVVEHAPNGYSGNLYSAVLLSDSEVVAGKKGSYYAVRLLNPAKETIPLFELGSYKLDPAKHQEVANAFSDLYRRLLSSLSDGKAIAIYLRGRANTVPFKEAGTFVAEPCLASAISYLPYDGTVKRYASSPAQQPLPSAYTNLELPNLRAVSIACIAEANIRPVEVLILQGEVSATTDSSALVVEVLLFVGEKN